jgi:hypothetical protein
MMSLDPLHEGVLSFCTFVDSTFLQCEKQSSCASEISGETVANQSGELKPVVRGYVSMRRSVDFCCKKEYDGSSSLVFSVCPVAVKVFCKV